MADGDSYKKGAKIFVPVFVIITVAMIGAFAFRMHQLKTEQQEILRSALDADAAVAMVASYCAQHPDDAMCGGETRDPVSTGTMGECVLPLAEYCGSAPCAVFDNQARSLRALIARYGDSGCLQVAQIGECGSFRVVAQSDGYVSRTEFFDSRGALVGVQGSSDTNEYCGGKSFRVTYGAVPTCTLHVTEDLCPKPK